MTSTLSWGIAFAKVLLFERWHNFDMFNMTLAIEPSLKAI
jgi:hypothetical protein